MAHLKQIVRLLSTGIKSIHLLVLIFCLYCFPTIVQASYNDGDESKIRLQLRWYHQFQFAGYYAAIEKGYYNDAGFDVTLIEGGSGKNTIDEVTQGNADYGVTNSELLLHRLNGKPLVVLASIFQHSPLVFVTRKDSGISTPQDLSGKFVKMSRSSRDIELHATLHGEGINFDKLILLDGFASYNDYFDASIDALAAYITNQPYYLKKNNIDYTIIRPASYGIDFYGDCLFTTEQEVKLHPERVAAFRKATLQGWEYALANPFEIIDLIIKKYKSKKDKEHLIYEAEEMRKLILPDLVNIGHMNPGRWQHIAETFHDFNLVPTDYTIDGFMYNPQKEVMPPWLFRALLTLAFITFAISTVTLLLLLFNRRLKKEIAERKITEQALQLSEQKLQNYSRQTEQFSLSAASILSIRDEKVLFAEISKAIVEHSDFKRVLISLFKEEPPFRELIGFAGVPYDIIEKVRNTELQADWFSDIFSLGTKLGQCSYYVPHTLKDILNQEAIIYGNGPAPSTDSKWHPEDNLFVRMNDENGEFIGIISVDTSKSGEKPTDEVVRPLEIYASLISSIIILKREHTRRHQLEHQLRHSQKMEAIGKLTGGIAHDFNNILGIIIGNAELALLDTPEWNSSHKNLNEIKSACLRAKDIVQHLLTFSRKSDHELRRVNISKVLQDSLKFLKATIPPDVELINQIEMIEEDVYADPPQLYQVLLNLCTNAVHAMEDQGGTLSISATQEIVKTPLKNSTHVLNPGNYVRIDVADSGSGIDQVLLDKIFDPYYTTKDLGQGTGLGLSIVHGIILNHNGSINVTSNPGEGSCFSIYLPTVPGNPVSTSQDFKHFSANDGRIMLVDDDQELLTVTSLMLQKLGYSVESFESPRIALEKFINNPHSIDLLITDMTMPGINGGELAARFLEIREDLPIFLCTGYSDKIDEQLAVGMGISKYFEKPINSAELAQAIQQVIAEPSNT